MKPKGLNETTILMCLFNLSSYATLDFAAKDIWVKLFISTDIIFVSFVVLWFYWRGRNWARILVLIMSVLTLFTPVLWGKANAIEKPLIVGEVMLAIFLLYWLNTTAVFAYFKNRDASKLHGEPTKPKPISDQEVFEARIKRYADAQSTCVIWIGVFLIAIAVEVYGFDQSVYTTYSLIGIIAFILRFIYMGIQKRKLHRRGPAKAGCDWWDEWGTRKKTQPP